VGVHDRNLLVRRERVHQRVGTGQQRLVRLVWPARCHPLAERACRLEQWTERFGEGIDGQAVHLVDRQQARRWCSHDIPRSMLTETSSTR